MKPFNLEAALAGEPVKLRSGAKAYIRHHETEVETPYPLFGFVRSTDVVSPFYFPGTWKEAHHDYCKFR